MAATNDLIKRLIDAGLSFTQMTQAKAETKSTAKAQANRRVAPRRNARGRVECRPGSAGQGSNVAKSLLDISETGARLLLRQSIEPGRRVELRLHGWGHVSPLAVVAQVIWCEPAKDGMFRIGVRFEQHLSYHDFKLLS